MDLPSRIRAYVDKMPVAVSGQGGSNACLAVACVLIWGWDLPPGEAMIYLEEYSQKCSPPWTHKELEHKLRSAEKFPPDDGKARGYLLKGSRQSHSSRAADPDAPKAAPKKEVKREEWARVDRKAVDAFVAGVPPLDSAWFARRSPVEVRGMTSGGFLDAVFAPGDRVIIFSEYYSQGDFLWVAGDANVQRSTFNVQRPINGMLAGGFRLSPERGVRAVPSALPRSGKKGVWYLVQPVSGLWEVGDGLKKGSATYTRRSQVNVRRWLHLVLESDEPDFEGEWMRVVASLKLPICAIYTSGGRSIHALVKYEVPSKGHWDAVKHQLERLVCPLGADPGALSAVRLSRLPGCFREGKDEEVPTAAGTKVKRYVKFPKPRLQELLYLNPSPGFESIFAMPEVRA